MQEIEGDNILKTDTWLRFLWQPRTQTADKQTIIPQRERGRITNVRDDKDPISSPDGTKAGRSQHWCHLSLQGPVRFSIRQSSCTRGWHATQASLMESRTKKKSDVEGSMSEGPGLSGLSLKLCPVDQQLSQSAHTGMDSSAEKWGKCQNNLWICNEWRPNREWIIQLISTNRRPGSFNFGVES